MKLKDFVKTLVHGTSLAVQWLGLSTFTALAPGSILGRGTKIPQAMWSGHKKQNKTKL